MPTMQARYYEDQYLVSRFIFNRANALGLTRRQVVERLGYRDRLAKGHEVLCKLLRTGEAPEVYAVLANVLEVDEATIDSVLDLTARQIEAETAQVTLETERLYGAVFRPHLQVDTERRVPSPIFVTALLTSERLRIVHLPDEIDSLDEEERADIVRKTIQTHYLTRGGRITAFGQIQGYHLVLLPGYDRVDYGIPYNRRGSQIGSMVRVPRVSEATLSLKKGDNRLTGLFKDDPIQEILFGDIDLTDLRGPCE